MRDFDGEHSQFTDGMVVAAGKEGGSDKKHLVEGDPEIVAELANAVGLIDSDPGDVEGGHAAESNGVVRRQVVEGGLETHPLFVIGIPGGSRFGTRLGAESAKGDLTAAINDLFSAHLDGPGVGFGESFTE